MSKNTTEGYPVDKVLTFAAEYAREIVEYEKRREDSILAQASNMQTAFAVVSAAIFIVAQILFEHTTSISFAYLTIIFSTIGAVLLFSLFAATSVQHRRKQVVYPKIEIFKDQLSRKFSLYETEAQRADYVLKAYTQIQNSLIDNNDKRIVWLRISMYAFYLALLLCVVFFFSTILKYS